jgi:kynureninase
MLGNILKHIKNYVDNNYILGRLNVWAYVNIKFFKNKSLSYIIYFLNITESFKKKHIKIYRNVCDFSSPFHTAFKIAHIILIILIV